MRLGFHYHIPAESKNGQIIMPGYLGRFIDSLAEYCEKVVCFLHSPEETPFLKGDYGIHSKNVNLVNIGPHASVPYRTLFANRYVKPLLGKKHELDFLLIRGPSPLLPFFSKAAKELPVALLLVGDYLAGIDDLPQPFWRKELIRLWSKWNNNAQNRVARSNLTFVNSRKLYNDLQPFVPDLIETRTTTLSQNDFFERKDTCNKPPYHLLYTGRLDRAKGLFEMVEALATLVSLSKEVIFHIVGWPEPGDPIVDELKAFAREKGVSDRLQYHGYKSVGPELFAYYKQADIYVIASKSSEGFPRTIWEAMAHSLPVIATRVGSIPDFIGKAAELIEPSNSEAISQAVIELLNNPEKRRKYIKSGIILAKQNTLEQRSSELVQHIEKRLNSRDA